MTIDPPPPAAPPAPVPPLAAAPKERINPGLWVMAVIVSLPGALIAWSDGTDIENAAGRVTGAVLLPFFIAYGLASLSKPRSNQRVLVFYCILAAVLFFVLRAPR